MAPALEAYSGEVLQAATTLLKLLFPRVKDQLSVSYVDWFGYQWESQEELFQRKAIATDEYFPRYFAYSVLANDISDQEFEALIQAKEETQIQLALAFSQRLGLPILLQRLVYRQSNFTDVERKSLLQTLPHLEEVAATIGANTMFARDGIEQLAQFILRLLEQVSSDWRTEYLLALVEREASFSLAFACYRLLRQRQEKPTQEEPELLTQDSWLKLLGNLLKRALQEAADQPLYRSHPFFADYLLSVIWPLVDQSSTASEYVLKYVEANPKQEVPILLQVLAPYGLRADNVKYIISWLGPRIYELARGVVGDEVIDSYPGDDMNEPSDAERVRQFVYLYERANTKGND